MEGNQLKETLTQCLQAINDDSPTGRGVKVLLENKLKEIDNKQNGR